MAWTVTRWLAIALSALLLLAGPSAGGQRTLSMRIEGGGGDTRVRVDPSTPVVLPQLPASSVELELVPPRGERLPKEVGVRLRAAASTRSAGAAVAEHELSCAVDARGAVRCAVPAGTWDLRLKAPGFVAHYLWERNLEAGRSARLGRFALRRGGSILGRVVAESGALDPSATRVEARPLEQRDGGSVRASAGLAKLAEAARPNAWGYFQTGPLARGAFEVSAT